MAATILIEFSKDQVAAIYTDLYIDRILLAQIFKLKESTNISIARVWRAASNAAAQLGTSKAVYTEAAFR